MSLLVLLPGYGFGQSPAPPALKGQQLLMANGAMLGVFFHEYGHMLISELKLPLTGPEEDVVDEFAALLLTAMLAEAPENQKPIFEGVLLGLALFWDISAEQQKKRGYGVPFFDEHSPDERRFANILCIGVGADPLRFAPVATRAGFSDARMRRCAIDYKKHRDAWDELFAKYNEGRGFHGRLTFEEKAPKSAAFEGFLEQVRRFPPLLEGMNQAIKLPRDIPVVWQECGFANAFWAPDQKRIILCYEMYGEVLSTFAKAFAAAAQEKTAPESVPRPQPAPNTPGGLLAGTWTCQSTGGQERLVLAPDGNFQSTVFGPMGQMQTWGKWSAASNILTLNVAGSNGPVPPMITLSYAMPDRNTIQVGGNYCQRAG